MNQKPVTASCAFVFDDKGQILAIENRRGWDIPGGRVEPGETPEETVVREILEEASVVVENPQLVYLQDFVDRGWHIAYYRCDVVEVKPFHAEFETSKREFMTIDDFLSCYGGEDLAETKSLIEKALKLKS